MEFDLETFMSEVTAALQPVQTSPRLKHSDVSQNPMGGEDMLQVRWGLSTSTGLRHLTSPSKRRRLSPSNPPKEPDHLDSVGYEAPEWDEFLNTDSPETGFDSIPDYFNPSLDMTTAIVLSHPRPEPPSVHQNVEIRNPTRLNLVPSEPLDMVPNFYAYSVKACLLPIRRVQHSLITHYFDHIHPLFPVVDEYHFANIYRKFDGQEELMNKADFIIYYAIMVAGFAHLSESELHKTPYRSVTEGQEAQVDQLKARYWSQQTHDPVVLTQVCLLLSLWSPGWVGFQNNSYWIDMAFKHAISANLNDPSHNASEHRHKVLWWCCVVRDRVLALGMRRPHRLHKTAKKSADIEETDFGIEERCPQYSDIRTKRVNMLAFMWLCKLSRIMEELAVIQRRTKFARDWEGNKMENIMPELKELNCLHQELKSWLHEFEINLTFITGKDEYEVPISVLTLRIIANSLRATLYQPYLILSEDHPALIETGIDPLHVIKEGARDVASSVKTVMLDKKSDAIPTWLVSWITLPVAVYHVDQRLRADSAPDKILMPFLAQLVRRTSGALMLLLTVRGATKDHLGESPFPTNSATQPEQSRFTFVHSCLSPATVRKGEEAKLLASVTKAIDSALELNGRN